MAEARRRKTARDSAYHDGVVGRSRARLPELAAFYGVPIAILNTAYAKGRDMRKACGACWGTGVWAGSDAVNWLPCPECN